MEKAFDASKYGEFSAAPYLDITIPTVLDPSLAPEGKHVLSAYVQFAPFKLKKGTWNARRDELGRTVLNTLATFADQVTTVAREVGVEGRLGGQANVPGAAGHIYHGELALDQLFTMRPVLDWARYSTPVRGLYLCGSGTHPGNGLTGGSGANAAREIIRDLR